MFVVTIIAAAVSAATIPAHATHGLGIDGITALTTSAGPNGSDLVFTREANGTIPVDVSIYRNAGNGWGPASMRVTLRAFALNADGTESDRVSMNFRVGLDGSTVYIPANKLATGEVFDLFVTFSDLGGVPVPTSHHSPQKNALITQGQYDLAEQFDFHHLVDATVA